MKKAIVIVLLFALLAFCLLAGVGGYFGYRWYKIKKHQAESGFAAQEPLFPWQKPKPPETPAEPQPEPAPGAEMPEPNEPPAQPPEEYTAPSAPVTTTPTAEPPKKPAAPKETAAAPKTPAPPPAKPEPWEDVQPDNVKLPGNEPLIPPPAPEPAPPPVKVKTPKGTFGFIFESTVEQGDVSLFVDEQLQDRQSFLASSRDRYRLEKNVVLPPGPHKVRLLVTKSDGKSQAKEWQITIQEKAVTIWKAEMKSFGREIELKQIAAQ